MTSTTHSVSVTVDIVGHPTMHLRIQLPEELDQGKKGKKQGRGVEKEKEDNDEKGQGRCDSRTEYVAASPRFTWTDEHVRCAKQERFGELLWPVVLRSHGLTEEVVSPIFGTYRAFLSSRFYLHSEDYPHHSLRELMEWYVEENLPVLRRGGRTTEEKEGLKRRKLLRSLFLHRNLTWSGEYLEVYQEWARTYTGKLNRYQKMVRFLDTFFDD